MIKYKNMNGNIKNRNELNKLSKYFPWINSPNIIIYILTSLIIIISITILQINNRNSNFQRNNYDNNNNKMKKKLTRCYICDNYASLMSSGEFKPGPGSGLAGFGGKPVIGGRTYLSSNGVTRSGLTLLQVSKLCSEKVNRTNIRKLIDSNKYGECSNINFNGCAKIVTKNMAVRTKLGRPALSAIVVSRTCAIIPEGYGIGCFDSVGGAGIRRTICYCQGDFCNFARKNLVMRLDFISFIICTILLIQKFC